MNAQRIPEAPGPDPTAAERPAAGGEPAGSFRHLALPYGSDDELLDTAVARLTAAAGRGHVVAAMVDPAVRRGLEQRLGRAGTPVDLVDLDVAHSYSGQTTAIRMAERLRELTAGGARVTVLRHDDVTAADDAYRAEVESSCDLALSGMPVTLICARRLDDPAPAAVTDLPAADHHHPELVLGATVTPNPRWLPTAEVLARTPVPPAPQIGTATQELTFGAGGTTSLRGVRAASTRHGLLAGLDGAHTEALVLAVIELVSNSIEHGAGHGTLSWWTVPGRVIVQIDDPGRARVALPGLRRPDSAGPRGRGVWLARTLSDILHIWSTPLGVHVRMEFGGGADPA